MILCADHKSLPVKHNDALLPPEFDHDSALAAREQVVKEIAKAGLQDVWVGIHCPDMKDKSDLQPAGFTYGFPKHVWVPREPLNPQRLRRIDRVHASVELMKLVTRAYPEFLGSSNHAAMQVDFEPLSFDNAGLQSRFYFREDILHGAEAMDKLETRLKKSHSTGAQWWEDTLSCIKLVAIDFRKECTPKKKLVESRSLHSCRLSPRIRSHQRPIPFILPSGWRPKTPIRLVY